MTSITNKGLARFLARVLVGLTFFMAGYWKCLELTPIGHAEKFFIESFSQTWIPEWLLWGVGVSIPILELVVGGMLILGLFQRYCFLILGAILITVTYGHLLNAPLFSLINHIFPRSILLIIAMILPENEDKWTLDYYIKKW